MRGRKGRGINKQNRNRLIDAEDRPMVARGEGGRGKKGYRDQEVQIGSYRIDRGNVKFSTGKEYH